MDHGISEQQWLEYLDGAGTPADRAHIEAHTGQCAECASLVADLTTWHALLCAEASRLREAASVSDAAVEVMLSKSFARIQQARPETSSPDARWTSTEAMILLRSLLEPMCGHGTARATIDLALRRSTIKGRRFVTGQNWKLFIANLSDAVASICGSAAGRLVCRAGICLVIEEGCP